VRLRVRTDRRGLLEGSPARGCEVRCELVDDAGNVTGMDDVVAVEIKVASRARLVVATVARRGGLFDVYEDVELGGGA
jgi:hypothetical protein